MKKAFEQQLPLWIPDENDKEKETSDETTFDGEPSSGVGQQDLELVFPERTVIPAEIAEELAEAESLLEIDEIERLNSELSVV